MHICPWRRVHVEGMVGMLIAIRITNFCLDLDSSNDESVYSNYHESSFGSSESEQEIQYLETK